MPAPTAAPGTRAAARLAAALRRLPGWAGPPVRARVAVYGVVLAAIGSWACFSRLDRGPLMVDEALFTFTTEHMRATGDYVIPSIGGPNPHLNAAPLYNWLCLFTAGTGDGDNLRYRGWSALFGVGCGLAALLLGAVLFGPEAGLLAGLLLESNCYFLFVHSAREGVMDTALAFFVTAAVACYAKSQSVADGRWWWAGVGACLGLAALTKPPAMGGFFFVMLCLHHLATRRDLSWKRRLAGPLAGAAVATLVALPWYAAVYARLGIDGLDHLLVVNSVKRAASAYGRERLNPRPWWFYCELVWESGWGFRVAAAALLCGCVSVAAGRGRFAWGLLLTLVGSFGLAISAAATRHWQYAYPAFPLLAVAGGGVLAAGFAASARLRFPAAVAGVALAAVAVRHDLGVVAQLQRFERPDYPPLLVHRAARDRLADGRARLVLYGFPRPEDPLDRTRGFSPSDRGYFPYRLPLAVRADSPAELDALLADGTPTVVFPPPLTTPAEFARLAPARPPDACLWFASATVPYPALAFNGAGAALRLREELGATAEPIRGTKP